jgi:transposase InsO family protein
MKQGMYPVPRKTTAATTAIIRKRNTGSFLFEVEHIGALWHNDYHHGKIRVVTANGTLKTPVAAAFIDDRSRFICHIQWFIDETCENLTHTLMQAMMRRGVPRSIVNDNGSPMIAEEFISGCENLGVQTQRIRKHSPWENGKIESFWKPLEGRLISMLYDVQNLTLAELNNLTQVWVEQEYHRSYHSEVKSTPLDVFLNHKSVLRDTPTLLEFQKAFRITVERQQRMTDHTITVDGVRYQVPRDFWHERRLRIAYARWDLSSVDVLNNETGRPLANLRPVDKIRNAEIAKERILSMRSNIEDVLPPLLREYYRNSKTAGEMSPYLSKDEQK